MSLIKMLYVDDSSKETIASKLDLLNERFSNARFSAAYSNEEALEKLTRSSYDVVLYDLGLEKDVDYPVAQRIKELKPGTVLIAMSLAIEHHKTLPSCFDGRIDTFYVRARDESLPDLLEPYGIILEKNEKYDQ